MNKHKRLYNDEFIKNEQFSKRQYLINNLLMFEYAKIGKIYYQKVYGFYGKAILIDILKNEMPINAHIKIKL